MTLSDRAKFWLVALLIVVSSCLGGIFGNWIFIYFMDSYYGLPAGNYTPDVPASSNNTQSARDFGKSNEAVAIGQGAEASLVGIFRRQPAAEQPLYFSKDKLGQGAVLTADGWILTAALLPESKEGSWKEYVVISSDKKMYDVDRVVVDASSQLTFIHLAKADNLPVRDFRSSGELAYGQNIFGLEWQGAVEQGIVSHASAEVRPSEGSVAELSVAGLSNRAAYFFDAQGRLSGIRRGASIVATDSIKPMLDQLLKKGAFSPAALGVNYVNLSLLANDAPADGILLAPRGKEPAVIPNSAADRAGLQAGDIITSFDNIAIGNAVDLSLLVAAHQPGQAISIDFLRKGQRKKATAILDPWKAK